MEAGTPQIIVWPLEALQDPLPPPQDLPSLVFSAPACSKEPAWQGAGWKVQESVEQREVPPWAPNPRDGGLSLEWSPEQTGLTCLLHRGEVSAGPA